MKSLTLVLDCLLLLPLGLLFSLDTCTLCPVRCVLLLPTNVGLIHKFSTTSDDLPAGVCRLALFLGSGNRGVEGGVAGFSSSDCERGVKVLDGVVQSDRKIGETGADDVSSWALERSAGIGLGRGGESIILESDSLADVVNGYDKLGTTASGHEELFQSLLVRFPRAISERLDKVENVSKRDGVVDLRKLLEQTREDDVAESANVWRVFDICSKSANERREPGACTQGLEVELKDGVELTKFGRDTLEDVLVGHVLEKTLTSGHLGQVEECHETLAVAALNSLAFTKRYGESREKNTAGSLV